MTEHAAPQTSTVATTMRSAFEDVMSKNSQRIFSSVTEPTYFHLHKRVCNSRLGYIKRTEKWPKARRKKKKASS